MALRVKCKCGKSLKISSKLADKRLNCPHCKYPFRIAAAKFESAARRAGVQRPGLDEPKPAPPPTAPKQTPVPRMPSPSPSPTSADPQPASLDQELLNELSGDFDESQSDILTALETDAWASKPAPPPQAVAVEPRAKAVRLNYAADGRPKRPPGSRLPDAIQEPTRGYWGDAFLSFVFPVSSANNAATCAFIMIVSGLTVFLRFAPCIGIIGIFIIYGWLASLYFSVILETAAGSNDLPGLKVEEGFFHDILRPMFKYIGAFAVVFAPTAILATSVFMGSVPQSWAVMIPIWLIAGLFMLPIILLLFAFEAVGMIVRIDLMVTTIFRTFLPYLSMWLMLVLVGFAYSLAALGPAVFDELTRSGPPVAPKLFQVNIGLSLFLTIVNTYLSIVAMRLVGLYYRHYKKRFTIVME